MGNGSKTPRDWQDIHAIWDGSMKDCLEGDCPTPCCVRKMMPIHDERRDYPYMTTFTNNAERDFANAQYPTLDALRIRVVEKLAMIQHAQGTDINRTLLVNNCINPRTYECEFKDRDPIGGPPLPCKIAPLSLSASSPITFPDCPQVLLIAQDPEVIDAIAAIRKRMGFDDPGQPEEESTETWLKNLAISIAQIEKKQR